MIAYHLPYNTLSHWQAWTYLILTVILGGVTMIISVFTYEETEAYGG